MHSCSFNQEAYWLESNFRVADTSGLTTNRPVERIRLLPDLREGEYDVLIGIDLLREGLDLPEVSLVAILDVDKVTDSMRRAIDETDRRREKQVAYNEEHGITPTTVIRTINDSLATILKADYADLTEEAATAALDFANQAELGSYITKLESDMREAAKNYEFERAANSATKSKDSAPRSSCPAKLGFLPGRSSALLQHSRRNPKEIRNIESPVITHGKHIDPLHRRSQQF
jgi:excinuclease UvrABC helicase subunit UvrB